MIGPNAERLRQRTRTSGGEPVSYTHLRAHETVLDLVCRLLLEKKKKQNTQQKKKQQVNTKMQ